MPDFTIPLADPFTATERGQYEAAWHDGNWVVERSAHGNVLRAGDTVVGLRVSDPALVVRRDPQQETDARLILGLPMRQNDARAATVRDYLVRLLATLWREQEGFSGKRPFGNSSWDHDLLLALADGGVVCAVLDEYGYIQEIDEERANELIRAAIEALGIEANGG